MRLSEIAHPTFAVLCLSALATLGVSQTQDCSGCVASSTEPTVMALPPGVQVELPTEADAVSDKDGLCALNGEDCGQRTPCSYVLSYTVSNTGGVTDEFVDKKEFQPGSTPGSWIPISDDQNVGDGDRNARFSTSCGLDGQARVVLRREVNGQPFQTEVSITNSCTACQGSGVGG